MLFIPLEKDIDWRRPPVITITLIILNIICYFGFQMNDEENYSKAMEYYFASGLVNFEVQHYKKYLENKNKLLLLFSSSKKKNQNLQSKKSIHCLWRCVMMVFFLIN